MGTSSAGGNPARLRATKLPAVSDRLGTQLEVLAGRTRLLALDGVAVGDWATEDTVNWVSSTTGVRVFRWASAAMGVARGRWEVWSRDPEMRGAERIASAELSFFPGSLRPNKLDSVFSLDLHGIILARQSVTGAPVWHPESIYVRVVPLAANGQPAGRPSNLVRLRKGETAAPGVGPFDGLGGQVLPDIQWISFRQYKPALVSNAQAVIQIIKEHRVDFAAGVPVDPVAISLVANKYVKSGATVVPGQRFVLWSKPNDGGFFEDLGDAFEAVGEALRLDSVADLVDWISSSYSSMKTMLIDVAADAISLTGIDCPRELLAAALDAGLMSLGIPPSLPDFDQIAAEGIDMLVAEITEQTGMPVGEALTLAQEAVPLVTARTRAAQSGPVPGSGDWFISLNPARPGVLKVRLTQPAEAAFPGTRLTLHGSLYHGFLVIPPLERGEAIETVAALYPHLGPAPDLVHTEATWLRDVLAKADTETLVMRMGYPGIDIGVLQFPARSGLDGFHEPLEIINPATG